MTKEQYENFIIKVFDYYNGKINIFNKARLVLNWASTNVTQRAGFTRLPNIVMINAGSMMSYVDSDNTYEKDSFGYIQFLYCITLETIIHELYHVDQIIYYKSYDKDVNYNTYIENAVEFMTHSYIANNVQDICYRFGIIVSYEIVIENMNRYLGYYYQRKDINYHISTIIADIVDYVEMDTLMNVLANPKGHVVIAFDDDVYHLKYETDYMPVEEVNELFTRLYYKYDFKEYYSKIIYTDNYTIIVEITQLKIKRTMVTI